MKVSFNFDVEEEDPTLTFLFSVEVELLFLLPNQYERGSSSPALRPNCLAVEQVIAESFLFREASDKNEDDDCETERAVLGTEVTVFCVEPRKEEPDWGR